MKEFKGTKGPWIMTRESREGEPGCVSIETEDYFIAQVDGGMKQQANARLIAAAPELLQALIEACECGMVPKSSVADGGAVRHSRQVQVADMIRAAIAKALGEDQ